MIRLRFRQQPAAIVGFVVGAAVSGFSSLVATGGRNEVAGVLVSAINGATVGLFIAWGVANSFRSASRGALFYGVTGSALGGLMIAPRIRRLHVRDSVDRSSVRAGWPVVKRSVFR